MIINKNLVLILKKCLLQRTAAMDRYQISIEEMLHNERQAEIKQEEDDRKRKEFQLHKVGFC